MSPLLKGLSEERVVLVGSARGTARVSLPLKGIVRLVDKRGHTLGLIFSPKILGELEEDILASASNTPFLESLNHSRESGRISGEEVKRKAGLK